MNSNGSKSTRRNQRLASMKANPPSSVSRYDGPIRLPSDRQEATCISMTLGNVFNLVSDSVGQVNNVISSSPSTASDWTAVSNVYDEFRVLGFQIKFVPVNRYSKTTTVTYPLGTVVDRDGISTSPTSFAQIMMKESFTLRSMEDPWEMTVRMDGEEDAGFVSVNNSSINSYAIRMYSNSNSFSTTYGLIFVYWRVQFRGRGKT